MKTCACSILRINNDKLLSFKLFRPCGQCRALLNHRLHLFAGVPISILNQFRKKLPHISLKDTDACNACIELSEQTQHVLERCQLHGRHP
jgi:hypothetical protein